MAEPNDVRSFAGTDIMGCAVSVLLDKRTGTLMFHSLDDPEKRDDNQIIILSAVDVPRFSKWLEEQTR